MPKFEVILTSTDTFHMTVEAETEDAALDIAYDEAGNNAELCAQDSGWGREWNVDASEWEEESIEELKE